MNSVENQHSYTFVDTIENKLSYSLIDPRKKHIYSFMDTRKYARPFIHEDYRKVTNPL